MLCVFHNNKKKPMAPFRLFLLVTITLRPVSETLTMIQDFGPEFSLL